MESSDLPTEHKPLSQPPLKYVAAVLEVLLLVDVILFIFFEQQAGLRENFAEATVTVEECPDLRWRVRLSSFANFFFQTGTMGPGRTWAGRGNKVRLRS